MNPKNLLATLALVSVVLIAGCKKDDFIETAGVCPLVVSTSPVDASAGVPLGKVITATFNEDMNQSTITTTSFTVESVAKGTMLVDGTISYSGTTASLTPSVPLLPNTAYTGTIKTSVKDLTGNALQAIYVWTFNTGTVPAVISSDPTNLSTGVALNKVISATFTEAMDPLTITASTFTVMDGTTVITGATNFSGLTASFTPASPLLLGKTYTATISTGAKNNAEIAIANKYVWTFSTGAVIVPTVTSTDPLNLATSISLNQVVTANFSVAMNPTTISAATFTLKDGLTPVTGAVNYTGTQATFTPGSALLSGKTYTATISTGAKNIAGTSLANNYIWTFSTGTVLVPSVISTDPADLAIDVPLNKVLTSTFSAAMDPSTITATTFILMDGLIPVVGVVNYSGTDATFTPGSPLIVGKTYTATITTGAKNTAGTALANNFVWNFTTVPQRYALTVVSANGTVVKNPDLLAYNTGSTTILTATAATGYTFTSWSGDATGSTNPLTVTMNADKNITANYTLNTYTLNVTAVNGTVVKNPDQLTYNHGSTMQLTATPAVGYTFTSWSGDAIGSTNPLTVTMNADKNITANFTVNAYSLNVTALNGVVAKNPNQTTYNHGTSVQLTATANPGYSFGSWSGDATGIVNPVTVTMDANKNITANFTMNPPLGPGAVDLGTAGNFAMLAKTGISTTGVTSVTGDIGVSPAAATFISGFGLIMDASGTYSTSTLVTGKVYAVDYATPTPAYISTAISDLETAFTAANGMTTSVINELGAGDISGMTLVPGLYKWSTGLLITNVGVTLAGGPNDTWVFQIADDFTVSNSAIITLTGGALAKNIFWVTATQAVLGTNVDFSGNILSQTLTSLNTGAKVNGRLLAQSAVTLNAATVVKP